MERRCGIRSLRNTRHAVIVRIGGKYMRGVSLTLAISLAVALSAPPFGVFAQSSVTYTVPVNTAVPAVTFSIQGVYWLSSSEFYSAPGGGTLETWTSQLYGIDFRADTRSHWGFHFNGVTGSEGNWAFTGAAPAGLSLNGTDTVWSADVSYSVQRPLPENPELPVTFRAFVGYGEAKGSLYSGNLSGLGAAALTTDSTGGRVGFDFSYPFQSGWWLNAGVAYAPSVSTRFSGSVGGGAQSVTATGTGWDAQASIRYTSTAHWNVEVGYRFVQEIQSALNISGVAICPCHTQWEGPFIAVGTNF